MSFRFQALKIPGVFLVEATRHGDPRGFFQESYRRSAFREAGIREEFVQDNISRSSRGVLRGLHFQAPPMDQGKLVRASRGGVYDVGVDLRVGSPTYGEWIGVELEDSRGEMLFLPPGLAHGYCVLTPEAELSYKVTAEYAPTLEGGVRWDDPALGIPWPVDAPVLSEKDLALPLLSDLRSPFRFSGREGP